MGFQPGPPSAMHGTGGHQSPCKGRSRQDFRPLPGVQERTRLLPSTGVEGRCMGWKPMLRGSAARRFRSMGFQPMHGTGGRRSP